MALAMKTTFQSYDHLKNAGMTEEQARGIVEVIENSADFSFKELATKSDLRVVRSDLKAEIAELRTELKTEIAEVKTEIAELRIELKTEIAELRTEVRADIAEVKTDIKGLKSSIRALQSMFVSGFLVIITGMVISFFHH